ncbi:MAG TPA: N-acetyltransferase [Caulobacteraceae bacterium]|jgi:predicted N-acetyltransferase YhbS
MTDAALALPPLTAETPTDTAEVDGLILRAFGPGRFVKAAERLREGRAPIASLSFVARAGGEVVGCVRQWRVTVGGGPAILLGPFAVDPEWRSQGLGAALIERACAAATSAGERLIVLVGDAPYFGPLGFAVAPRLTLPGPVDPRRVFLKGLVAGAADGVQGPVVPA